MMADWVIRLCREADYARMRELTVQSFDGVSVEQRIDRHWPDAAPMGWEERKWLEVAGDVAGHPDGCFVAQIGGEVVGYVTTGVNPRRQQGRIANLAVDSRWRGKGLGRALIQAALEHFRQHGLRVARIETLVDNAVGLHLYPKMGFHEIARQVYYAMSLDAEGR